MTEPQGRNQFPPVKLQDIIDALKMQDNESLSVLDVTTGAILTVATEEMRIAEDLKEGEDLSKYPAWQQDNIRLASEILEEPCLNDEQCRFVNLPSQYQIDEYSMMEEFCYTIKSQSIQDVLLGSIHGRGAFRRFKDTLCRYNIDSKWYTYKEAELHKVAVEWCTSHYISYM